MSEALVIDSTPPKQRGAAMGKIVMSSNMGFVIGPFAGAGLVTVAKEVLLLSEMDSYRFPFYFTALLALAGTVLVWLYVTDAKAPEAKKAKLSLSSVLRPDGTDQATVRNLNVLYLNAIMEGFAFSSIGPLMALFLFDRFELGGESISVLVGISMGLGALVAWPSGRLSDRVGRKKLFVMGGTAAFIATMLIPTTWSLVVVVLLLAARSMSFQVASPALRALQADLVPENVRGRLIGVLESMSNLGAVIGAPLGGILYDRFFAEDLGLPMGLDGSIVPFAFSGALGLMAVVLVQMLIRERSLRELSAASDTS
ncbi:TPA: MFS transporter [Thermoplasmata archaeon]|nr:MFS transporter [Thermoplasmata archaeon]